MFASGFFNSVSSDRRYNAEQMSAIFDGLINDGIFDSIGDHFRVTPAASGLGVSVGTGRAWLNSTWSYNDSAYPITLSAASASLGRKDLICLKVDKSTNVRANSIVCITGTPASTPVEPTVSDDAINEIYYHKLAAVTVQAGATSISTADITNYIGLSTGTPYVTGIIDSTSVDELWSQWDGEFNAWWEDVKTIIDEDTAAQLSNRIDHITPKESTMNLYGFTHINPPASSDYTYQAYSTDAILNQISSLLNDQYGVFMSNITGIADSATDVGLGMSYSTHNSEVSGGTNKAYCSLILSKITPTYTYNESTDSYAITLVQSYDNVIIFTPSSYNGYASSFMKATYDGSTLTKTSISSDDVATLLNEGWYIAYINNGMLLSGISDSTLISEFNSSSLSATCHSKDVKFYSGWNYESYTTKYSGFQANVVGGLPKVTIGGYRYASLIQILSTQSSGSNYIGNIVYNGVRKIEFGITGTGSDIEIETGFTPMFVYYTTSATEKTLYLPSTGGIMFYPQKIKIPASMLPASSHAKVIVIG